MSFSFFVKVEDVFIEESFVAELAKELLLVYLLLFVFLLGFAENTRNELFPPKERSRFPLLFKHFLSLIVNLFKLDEWIRSLKEVF